MTRLDFSPLFRSTVGFDRVSRLLEAALNDNANAAPAYPPYNIEQTGANALRIVLAVAGFTMDDLTVTVEGRQLIVRGRQTEREDRVFLHRGIAARQFQRTFMLAEGIEVESAALENGLLGIDLARPAVEEAVRSVPIRPGKNTTGGKIPTTPAETIDADPAER